MGSNVRFVADASALGFPEATAAWPKLLKAGDRLFRFKMFLRAHDAVYDSCDDEATLIVYDDREGG